VLEGSGSEVGEHLGRVRREVLARHPTEQIAHEGGRNGGAAGFQHRDGFRRQLASHLRPIELHWHSHPL
jgi:hypothetical protein